MKWRQNSVYLVLIGVLMLTLSGTNVDNAHAVDVCSSGVSEPPFLSYGIKSNLLLVIDNSGSMLDMAYTDADDTQCFDDSYATTNVYAGNFTVSENNTDVWYEWVDGPYSPWQNATEYGDTGEPERVYVNGIIYEVQGACTSAGSLLRNDTGCSWEKLIEVDSWQQSAAYAAGEFVLDAKQLYVPENACTASIGNNITDDTGCTWEPVDHTWSSDTTYAVGDIVTYNGKYFEAQSSAPAVGGVPGVDAAWAYLQEGKFVEISGGVADVTTYCDSGAGSDSEYMADMCIRVDTTTTPSTMKAFAAKGSFLNWLTASKFDIQKEILTGGKYDEDQGLIISENRGCAGSGFVKEIALDSAGDFLTMRVRGSFIEDGDFSTWDWVDTTDDTTRLEILGFSASGFDMEACQNAIDKIIDVGSGFQNDVDQCLSGSGTNQRNALNHALQYCWQDTHVRDLKTISDDCEALYGSLSASEVGAFDDAYNCYGIYDDQLDHDNRTGYAGRCWDQAQGTSVGGSTCDPKPRVQATCDWLVTDPCEFWDGGTLFRQTSESQYVEKCTDLHNDGTKCQNDNKWATYYIDSISTAECDPTDPAYGIGAGTPEWSDLLYPFAGSPTDPTLDPDYNASVIPNNPGIGDGTDAEWWCIYQAMEDYCSDLQVPEVIDPSDQASTTTEYWNIPGNLVDAGVYSQLGIDQPVAVMKGFIESTTAPEGILQEVKDDLRIGVMAFNDNGAKTECDAADTSDAIENYCPDHTEDGAEVMSNIILGSTDVGGGREHIEDVVDAINTARATSWTPLAEAVFNAIGYYTQRTDMRLNADDFQISAGAWTNGTAYTIGDVVTWPDAEGDDVFYQATTDGTSAGSEPSTDAGVTWSEIEDPDPVTNYCQENHVLIITEGASTADINQDVIDFVDNAAVNDGDQASDMSCTGSLNSSTYLDDLTFFAQNSSVIDLYGAGNSTLSTGEDSDGDGLIDEKDKQKIKTHIIVAGSLRDEGNDECSPDELISNAATNGGTGLLSGENPGQLEENIIQKISDIRQRSSAGSAASVISSSRGGEGAIYQAIFWPEMKRTHADGTEYTVEWVGDVHALFINDAGYMYEDTDMNRTMDPSEDIDGDGHLDIDEDVNNNGLLDAGEDDDNDGKLDIAEDTNGNGTIDGNDLRVIIYFDEDEGRSRACYNTEIFDTGECTNFRELEDVKFLWEAAGWLNDSSLLTSDNRTYISADKKRYIFTWIDLNNNGIVDDDHDGTVDDDDEIRPFVEGLALNSFGTDLAVSGTRSPVYADFGVSSSEEVDEIVSWLRGEDSLIDEDDGNGILDAGEDLNSNGRLDRILRSRQLPSSEGSSTLITYRHPDTIHSTPMTVSEPAEGFHLLYRDRTYANFVARWKERRHVIYYGKNNGMLTAVNGGFYKEDEKKFCLTDAETDGDCDESAGGYPALGAELWSYIPYNMLPHLGCLTEEAYAHKYFVDLRPRIFDVKIFTEESACTDGSGIPSPTASNCIHPDGWGTILVGGMRLGGGPVKGYDLSTDTTDDVTDDNRQFISSYFILDITNPEEPPIVLGELTQTLEPDEDLEYVDLGYTTAIPTMVIMKNPDTAGVGSEKNDWYLILGSGPHGTDAMKGVSDQNAKVSVLPLSWLGATDLVDPAGKTALRIPSTAPTSGTSGGTFELSGSPNGFVSDLITVDFDIDPSTLDYMSDTVYFGTTEGDFITNADQTTEWDGGGILYRLVTRPISGGISTYGPGITQVPTTPDEWQILPLIDLSDDDRPISSAASVGYDGRNFWVYFGTGRYWDPDDKTDTTQQTFFGIKEPMNFNSVTGIPESFTWEEVEFTDNIDSVTGADIGFGNNAAGARGLLRVDDILVSESAFASSASLSCLDTTDTVNGAPLGAGNISCVPAAIRTGSSPDTAFFVDLEKYIAGTTIGNCASDNVDCTDGWYKDFWPYGNRERNLGQATLLGGLVTFTTYQPYSDVCQAEGQAYLYAVYYKTGTSWYENVFGEYGLDAHSNVKNKLDLGRGLATTPNLHTGSGGDEGPRAFIQTSTGEIKEIQQENLPIKGYKSGRSKWKEYIP